MNKSVLAWISRGDDPGLGKDNVIPGWFHLPSQGGLEQSNSNCYSAFWSVVVVMNPEIIGMDTKISLNEPPALEHSIHYLIIRSITPSLNRDHLWGVISIEDCYKWRIAITNGYWHCIASKILGQNKFALTSRSNIQWKLLSFYNV